MSTIMESSRVIEEVSDLKDLELDCLAGHAFGKMTDLSK